MKRKFCVDPLKNHKKKISKDIRKISNELFVASKNLLKEDTLLCRNCRSLITKDPNILRREMQATESEASASSHDEKSTSSNEDSDQDKINIDSILKDLGVSPIKKRKYT